MCSSVCVHVYIYYHPLRVAQEYSLTQTIHYLFLVGQLKLLTVPALDVNGISIKCEYLKKNRKSMNT